MPEVSPASRLRALLLACAALVLASCGGSDDPEGAEPDGGRGSGTTGTPAPDDAACPGDVPATVTAHLQVPAVTGVELNGQCTNLVITTLLGDQAGDTAVGICDKAAEVAYEGDVMSVRVLSVAETELAVGILAGDEPAPCLSDVPR
jgi:hypothetical protein